MSTIDNQREVDPVTRITAREREDCFAVSGGTLVRHDVGADGNSYYRFVPATREIARRLLRAALQREPTAQSPSAAQQTPAGD